MKVWFEGLAPREQRVVVGGAIAAAAVLLYLLVVEPVAQAFAAREQRIQSLESQVSWMRETAAEVARLQADGGGEALGSSDQPPYLAVDNALRGAGLPQPQRLEPDGEDGARLEFESVPFDPLVRIIGRLRSESGLRVTRARIERLEEPGRVSARLTFERGGA